MVAEYAGAGVGDGGATRSCDKVLLAGSVPCYSIQAHTCTTRDGCGRKYD